MKGIAGRMQAREALTLFRPTGERELALVRESGWSAFPPRLADQPFFYPVLNEAYATQIDRLSFHQRGRGANSDKTDAIGAAPVMKTVDELNRFTGCPGYGF